MNCDNIRCHFESFLYVLNVLQDRKYLSLEQARARSLKLDWNEYKPSKGRVGGWVSE